MIRGIVKSIILKIYFSYDDNISKLNYSYDGKIAARMSILSYNDYRVHNSLFCSLRKVKYSIHSIIIVKVLLLFVNVVSIGQSKNKDKKSFLQRSKIIIARYSEGVFTMKRKKMSGYSL